MKNKIIFLLLDLLLFGCNSKNLQQEKLSDIQSEDSFFTVNVPDLWKEKREVFLSEIAESIEYIPLETSNESLVGNVLDVQLTKDYIFISQRIRDNRPLLQFDRAGNFIRQIGKIGRGPEEYVQMRGFSIDKDHKRIYVLASYNGTVHTYSFDGDYIKSFKFPQSYGDIVWSRDSSFICYSESRTGTEKNIFEERNSNNEIEQYVRNTFFWQHKLNYVTGFGNNRLKAFYRLNDKLHFKSTYNDTVYTYNDDKIIPKYFLDLKDFRLPDQLRTEVTGKMVTSPKYYWVSPQETARYLFIFYCTYSTDQSESGLGRISDYGFITFDKTKMDGWAFLKPVFVNDLNGGPSFYPDYVSDSLAICCESAFNMKRILNKADPTNKTTKLKEQMILLRLKFKDLNESDNPIITIVKLKS